MNVPRSYWVMTGMLVVIAVLATLLVRDGLGTREAAAQAISESRADYVSATVGPLRESRVPIFIVDTKSQVIMVYEYDLARRTLYLRVGRSFRNDRRLDDQNFGEKNSNWGPSVKEVEPYVK